MPRTFRQLIHTLTGPANEPAEPVHPNVVVEYDDVFRLPQGMEPRPQEPAVSPLG